MKQAQPSQHRRLRIHFVAVGVVAMVLTILTIRHRVDQFPLAPPAALPLPTAHAATSGPLVLSPESSNVLGTEDIDPYDIVNLVNQQRIEHGFPTLRPHPLLMEAAQMRARVILEHQNFSHQDPFEGIILTTVLPKVGYAYAYASENIGMGDSTAIGFVNGFMNSISHRDNMLNPELKDIGIAVATGPFDSYYVNIVVQLFAIPGSINEYKGYSISQKASFKDALIQIDDRLTKARTLLLLNYFDKRDYYEDWISLLKHQRTIAQTVYTIMERDEPLTSEHILLIKEYNENWKQAPPYPTT